MQTHGILRFFTRHIHKRGITVLSLLVCMGLLSGCAVRVEGRAEYEAAGTCEHAYYAARDASQTADSGTFPLFIRYAAADAAQHNWLDVAIQCPARFTEGTMRSAQAQYTMSLLASRLHIPYQPLTVSSLDGIASMKIAPTALAQMALAEDQAGFATEVLAGRWAVSVPASANAYAASLAANTSAKLLTMSDNHKETASQLMYIAGSETKDLRRKVYATQTITANPGTVTDPSTGVQANTLSVVELNTARQELEALANNAYNATDVESSSELRANLLQLSMLIATSVYTAFKLGYPNVDGLLYQQ